MIIMALTLVCFYTFSIFIRVISTFSGNFNQLITENYQRSCCACTTLILSYDDDDDDDDEQNRTASTLQNESYSPKIG